MRGRVWALVALSVGLAASAARADGRGTILVTGFEPVHNEPRNPSQRVVERLDGRVIDGFKIVGVVLPVDYKRVEEQLPALIERVHPDAYVAFGKGYAREYLVEKVARNKLKKWDPDNSGFRWQGKIREDGPDKLESTLPMKEIDKLLKSLEKKRDGKTRSLVLDSKDSGAFLCNFTFYLGAYELFKEGRKVPVGFVHLAGGVHEEQAIDEADTQYDLQLEDALGILDVVGRSLGGQPSETLPFSEGTASVGSSSGPSATPGIANRLDPH